MNEKKIWVISNGKSFGFKGVQFSNKPVQVKNELWVRSLLNEKPQPSLKMVDEPKKKIKKEPIKTDNKIKEEGKNKWL